MSTRIKVQLADDELEQLAQGGPQYGPQLSRLLDEHLNDFDHILQDELGGRMIPMERAMVKTYLYRMITNRALNGHGTKPIDVVNEVLVPTQ